MSRFYSYLNSAKQILSLYKGEVPFSAFLKSYFAHEKKFGSRDRKAVASLCYNFFRTGAALRDRPIQEAILTGSFLSNEQPTDLLENLHPEWNAKITLPLTEKLAIAGVQPTQIFPFNDLLSPCINIEKFNLSFLI